MSFLLGAFLWGKDNFKWIAIALAVIIAGIGLWRYTKLVSDYATAQQTIIQLEQNIEAKERALQLERDLNKLADEAIEKIEREKTELAEKLEDVTKDLPEDSKDLAPESIRETLRRLGLDQ